MQRNFSPKKEFNFFPESSSSSFTSSFFPATTIEESANKASSFSLERAVKETLSISRTKAQSINGNENFDSSHVISSFLLQDPMGTIQIILQAISENTLSLAQSGTNSDKNSKNGIFTLLHLIMIQKCEETVEAFVRIFHETEKRIKLGLSYALLWISCELSKGLL